MRATLFNFSPLPRQHWGVVTFPRALAATFPVEAQFRLDDGRIFRAVRGADRGCKTVYRVRATMGGHELAAGTLERRPEGEALPDWRPHPWVSDDFSALIPSLTALAGRRVVEVAEKIGMDLVDQSPAHQRWWIRLSAPRGGTYLEWWADLLHDDPVVPIWGKFVWSHRASPDNVRRFDGLALTTGEMLSLDFATRQGVQPAFRENDGSWTRILNSRPLSMSDGSGLPLSGALLAFVSPGAESPAADPEDLADPLVAGLRDLKAGLGGPIAGVAHDWDGYFLANENTPRLDESFPLQWEADATWQRFLDEQAVPADWFVERPVAIGRTPSQTGGQEDFGATKGTLAVTGLDPRFIRILQHSVQAELFRGFNHYEDDGRPLVRTEHPDWVTWSGRTHYHPGVSPDRLGKRHDWAGPPPGTGWIGYDDQHRSQNNLAAYLALSDDPLMEDQIAHLATTDEAAYRVRYPENGPGAARAQGRMASALAQLATVSPDETRDRLVKILAQRIGPIVVNPTLQVEGPMKVLSWGSPDGRKPIVDAEGKPGRWASMWEHGLAAVGLYIEHKRSVQPAAGVLQTPTLHDLDGALQAAATMLATFGCFYEPRETATIGGKTVPVKGWWTVDDILYSDGAPPPGGLYAGSPHFTHHRGARGVGVWTFAGLLVARELVTDEQLRAKLDDYVLALTGGREAPDLDTAEWWAVVRKVADPR